MPVGQDTKARIKAEAMRLFVARGIDAVSIRDIADEVGMKPSNLYAHFRSRDEMVQELFEEGYGIYAEALSAIARREVPFPERLAAMIEQICRLHDEDSTLFRFLLLSQYTTLAALPDTFLSPIEILQQAIAAAMERGEVPPGNSALLTAMIVGIVLQTATFELYGRLRGGLVLLAPDLVASCLALAQRPTIA